MHFKMQVAASIFAILSIVFHGTAHAMGVLEPYVEEDLVKASFVGRIKIQEREPVRIEESSPVCGYVYKVIIVDSFRGGDAGKSFFGGVTEDFQGAASDYVAITHSVVQYIGSPRLDYYFGDPKELACLERSGQKTFVQARRQNLWAIEKDEKNTEWLSINRLNVVWCSDNGSRVRSGFEFKEVAVDALRQQYPYIDPRRAPTYEAARKILLRGLPVPVSFEMTSKTGLTEVSARPGNC